MARVLQVPCGRQSYAQDFVLKGRNSLWKTWKTESTLCWTFKILARVGPVAYKLERLAELQGIHNTFHVSNLKKCLSNESLIIPLEEAQLDDKLHFIEEPMEIMDREVKQLKQSHIPIVKKCLSNESLIIPLEEAQLDDKLHFIEEPMEIMDREVKQLKQSHIPIVKALPSPDYVPGPEEPEQAPPLPVYIPYIPDLVYPEYIPPKDDVFPAKDQPLLASASPTANSPGYIPESDPDEDPKDD
nr:reverse transcriptase domain-containing protein [Tanacetum cinerariifolium]